MTAKRETNSGVFSAVSRILRLDINRFRGIRTLKWVPHSGVNVVIGGGDVGKTTILEAIALLLSPTNQNSLTDFDYYDRDATEGFAIDAVLALSPETAS